MTVPALARQPEPFTTSVVWREIAEGWNFLRRQPELFTNTIVTAIAQIGFGAEIVLAVLYAERVLDRTHIGYPANYSLLLAAVG
ncbi:MAG TPA: hypothetical protein VHK06_04565, partial [Candidatus Limnocylindria bacterium]|nr:hypothetical protein [Candidatus Limnocylindria bacterium]